MEQKPNGFKTLQMLHRAMLFGMLLLSGVSVFMVVSNKLTVVNADLAKTLQVVALLLAIGGCMAGFSIFNKRISAIQNTGAAQERMNAYRSSAILRWALIEAPVIFSCICFMITGNYAFFALAVALMMAFVITVPAKNKVIWQLQLNEAEVAELEGKSE